MVDRGTFSKEMKDLTYIHDKIRSKAQVRNMTPMGSDFQPDNWSVICGRGRECYDHIGNRRFRLLVEIYLSRYQAAKTKFEKSVIVMDILDTVREASSHGGFVKYDASCKRWFEVGDSLAREKIGQQFRTSISDEKRKQKQRLSRKKTGAQTNTSPALSDTAFLEPFKIDLSTISTTRHRRRPNQKRERPTKSVSTDAQPDTCQESQDSRLPRSSSLQDVVTTMCADQPREDVLMTMPLSRELSGFDLPDTQRRVSVSSKEALRQEHGAFSPTTADRRGLVGPRSSFSLPHNIITCEDATEPQNCADV